MSRIGKYPVAVPDGVEVSIAEGLLTAKGKLGEETVPLHEDVQVQTADGAVTVTPRDSSKRARQLWGTTRSLIDNAVTGVSQGFTRRLNISGVGYRAQVQGSTLNLQLGFSHDVKFAIPDGIKIAMEGDRGNVIAVSGPNKQLVGQVASEIRSYRPPEPYKGKGLIYTDESILRKEGKKK